MSEDKRIHVVQILEATDGGTRTHILQLLEGLDRKRFRQTLIASCARNPRFREDFARIRAAGAEIIEIPMRRSISPFRDTWALLRLWRALRKLDCDVVHTHASKAGILGRRAAR